MPDKPRLSLVCVSRNDNHGGDPLARLVYSCASFVEQSEKFQVSTEYVVVEWNPPVDRPSLAQELRSRIRPSSFAKIRIITVPAEVHREFKFSDKLPLFQMIGKNVGIRRARAEFVLSSNIDIVLGNRLFAEITLKKIKSGIIYRSHRLDVNHKILQEKFAESLALSYATRLNVMPNTIQLGSGADILQKFGGFSASVRRQIREILQKKLTLKLKRLLRKNSKNKFRLHTNACGDFQLLDRDSWHRLQGFSEMQIYSFHLDSLFMYDALSQGVYSIVLPAPFFHYHIDHSDGWIPEDPNYLFSRLRSNGIGFMDQEIGIYEELYRRGEIKPKEPHESWGLADRQLEEQTL